MVTFSTSEQYLQALQELRKSDRRENYPEVLLDLARSLWTAYESELKSTLDCDKKDIFAKLSELDKSGEYKIYLENLSEFATQIAKDTNGNFDGEWFDAGLDAMVAIVSFIDEIKG